MARQINRLSARAVATMKDPGRHADGGGLYLAIDGEGRRRWVLRFRWGERVRDLGLGACPPVTLADAREAAEQARRLVAKGIDPIAERAKARAEARPVTFRQAADELLETFNPSWKNAKHRQQWANTLDTYCEPIMQRPVSEVSTADVLSILKPIWQEKPETASRVRGRIERVLALAKVRGWRTGENPATWRNNLDQIMPRPKKLTRGHHGAMDYAKVPAFVAKLRERDTVARLALEFTILTAARTSETTGARWEEFDLDEGVWNVPPERMKARRPHRVPLCARAIEIVHKMEAIKRGDYVFGGAVKRGQQGPLSGMSMAMILRRSKLPVTVHGFRSAFKDWSSEQTPFPNEISEAALAHVIANKTEAAYRRGDLFEKRRALMNAWASYIENPPKGNVVPMVRAEG